MKLIDINYVAIYMHETTGKMLCYCRLVYMPMSYLYGKRFVGKITTLVESLRREIHSQPYAKINWNEARNSCAKVSIYNNYIKLMLTFCFKFYINIIRWNHVN